MRELFGRGRLLLGFLALYGYSNVHADETSSWSYKGDIGVQFQYFPEPGLVLDDQQNASLFGNFELDYERGDHGVHLNSYFRLDSDDDERSIVDLQDFYWRYYKTPFEIHLGYRTVFWGVTESQHLVDIVNQSNFAENIDGEDKFGQPMMNINWQAGLGTLELYWLLGFQERRYPGKDGRLNFPIPIDSTNTKFESSQGKSRIDIALRWQHTIGGLYWGLSHFYGNSRTPDLSLDFTPSQPDAAALRPFYPVVNRTGLELEYLVGGLAVKFEGINESGGAAGRYAAATFGFEYTQVGVIDRMDIGWVMEYSYDDRETLAPPGALDNDLALAMRLNFNDSDFSSCLIGALVDLRHKDRLWSLECTTGLSESWTLNVEGRIFETKQSVGTRTIDFVSALGNQTGQQKFALFETEDYLKVDFIYHF